MDGRIDHQRRLSDRSCLPLLQMYISTHRLAEPTLTAIIRVKSSQDGPPEAGPASAQRWRACCSMKDCVYVFLVGLIDEVGVSRCTYPYTHASGRNKPDGRGTAHYHHQSPQRTPHTYKHTQL